MAFVGWVSRGREPRQPHTDIVKGGTVAFCAVMIATIRNHGGLHGWDVTAGQAQQAAYVRMTGPLKEIV